MCIQKFRMRVAFFIFVSRFIGMCRAWRDWQRVTMTQITGILNIAKILIRLVSFICNLRSVKIRVHMIMALAMVPEEDVVEIFTLLQDDMPDIERMNELMTYVDETYVSGRPARGNRRRRNPTYPIRLWNHYDTVLQGRARTNNASESWHNRFQILVGKKHPDLYTALTEIQKEQGDVEISVIESNLGRCVKEAPSKKWREFHVRLRNIVAEYDERKEDDEVLDYLRNIAYTIIM